MLVLAATTLVASIHVPGVARRSVVRMSSPPLRPRTLQIDPTLSVTIFEIAKPKELVELWMGAGSSDAVGAFSSGTRPECDPFGVVLWPGAQLAAQILSAHKEALRGRTVCTLGVGTGLEALAAAQAECEHLILPPLTPHSSRPTQTPPANLPEPTVPHTACFFFARATAQITRTDPCVCFDVCVCVSPSS